MRRLIFFVALCALIAGLTGGVNTVRSQDATPEAGASDVRIENVAISLAAGQPDRLLTAYRIAFQPGGEMPSFTQPGSAIYYVERGSLTVRVTGGDATGDVQVIRRGEATPIAEVPVSRSDGGPIEFTLNAGDAAVFGGGLERSIRSEGAEAAVVFVSALLLRDQPPFRYAEGTDPATLPEESGMPVIAEAIATGLATALPNVDEPLPDLGDATPEP